MRRSLLLGLFLSLSGWVGGTRTEPAWAASTPTKLTVMVPMRDGVRLATDVYLPAGDGPWPVAVLRTPFGRVGSITGGPYGELFPLAQLAQNGIVLVSQDTRGRYDSEGKARLFVDDGWGQRQDGYDTIAWIRQQPWCNGKIATLGNATPGIN